MQENENSLFDQYLNFGMILGVVMAIAVFIYGAIHLINDSPTKIQSNSTNNVWIEAENPSAARIFLLDGKKLSFTSAAGMLGLGLVALVLLILTVAVMALGLGLLNFLAIFLGYGVIESRFIPVLFFEILLFIFTDNGIIGLAANGILAFYIAVAWYIKDDFECGRKIQQT